MKLKVCVSFIFIFCGITAASWALPDMDARNLALGGMAVADITISDAMFFNPAVLSHAEGLETSFTQTRLTASDFDFAVGASFPIISKNIGLGFGWDAVANQNQVLTGIVRDSNGQVIIDPNTGLPLTQILGFFTQSINTFYASLGVKVGFYSLGVTLKYYLSDFGSFEGTGVGLDVGLRADINPNLYWGVLISDINNSVIDFHGETVNQTVPFTWTTSIYWKFLQVGEVTAAVEPSASNAFWDTSVLDYGAGIELGWLKSIFLRASDTQQSGFNMGIGLVAHPVKVFKEIRVDYTYLGQAPNGYPSRLTLSVDW
jgi:hypothetical protein